MTQNSYHYYSNIFKSLPKPLAFIDYDLLLENVQSVLTRCGTQKKIRLGTKSIRCTNVLSLLFKQSTQFSGLMTYDVTETLFLARLGFKNLLIAYPIVNKQQIDLLLLEIKKGSKIIFMVDLPEHVKILEERCTHIQTTAHICLDIDMSSQFPFLYFGVQRSALQTPEQLNHIIKTMELCTHIKLEGVMGYEAQIAGVGDNEKNQPIKNKILKWLKQKSFQELSQRRQLFCELLEKNNFKLSFVNGGGTGSLEYTKFDQSVTEITVGSAFYSSHLFDSFQEFKHKPAAGFALEITRQPKENIFTCNGGGYIASGAANYNKLPQVYLPEKLFLLEHEGAGEVQTPFLYKGKETLKIGDTIFMRHAKAGELCERFNELSIVSNGKIIDTFKTYRGEGLCTL